MSGVTVTVPEPVPAAGDRLSQLAFSEAVQLSEPPPLLPTLSVLAGGLEPPCVPLKDRADGVTDSTGEDGPPFLNTTVAMSHGVAAPVETLAAGVSPWLATASSTRNSMSFAGETLTR